MKEKFIPLTFTQIQKIKSGVRERDGNKCVKCGILREEHLLTYCRNLEVHRIIPGCEYHHSYCITLCQPCHKLEPREMTPKEAKTICDLLGLEYPRMNMRVFLTREQIALLKKAAQICEITVSDFLLREGMRAARNALRQRRY